MERVTINYQSPTRETLKRAEQWIKEYADPAHPIIIEYVLSDEAFRKLQDAKANLQIDAEGLGE